MTDLMEKVLKTYDLSDEKKNRLLNCPYNIEAKEISPDCYGVLLDTKQYYAETFQTLPPARRLAIKLILQIAGGRSKVKKEFRI